MRVTLCGVRGSAPAPGAEFDRYGGHTSCVAVAAADGPPSLILDAGSGLRQVAPLLDGAPFAGTILLSHLHWDHWQGLPFFKPGFIPGARVTVLAPEQAGPPEKALTGMMTPPYFPVEFAGLGAGWSFDWARAGLCDVEGFRVTAMEIPHKASRTFGYRIEDGTSSMAYITDHAPSSLGAGAHGDGPLHEAVLTLAEGVDLLITDAQHVRSEFPDAAFLGHATAEYAVELAQAAGAQRLVLFHHDPERTDDELDSICARLASSSVPVEAARQGRVFQL
ncbi:MAG TPA: MBL fold metallo-hydrolase [Motilibacteraceae bacterium]|nr:MBL fold metallo-hydrolase [Motilibacteraceae bacterium]